MSQTVSNTINVAVKLEGADDAVVRAQETAKTLDAVAESSQAVQTATINEVARARSRSGAALEAEKKATVAAFAEIGAAVEEEAKRETAALNAVAEAVADGEKKRRDAANANVESWTKVGNAVASASAQKSSESLASKLNAVEAGSSALYSMQVGAAKNYQTKALDYAARQTSFAERSLRELGQIRQAFATNAIPVWRG